MHQELQEHLGGTSNCIRESGNLHRRGELCAETLKMSRILLCKVERKGISSGGNSMSKDTEI